MKKIICILLIAAIAACLSACARSSTNLSGYESFAQDDPVMPVADEVGEYTSLHALKYHDGFIFEWNAYTLIVCYDSDQYEIEKQRAEECYVYEDEVLKDHVKEHDLQPHFTLGEYDFHLLDVEEYRCFFPESYYIGFNDEENRIAYIYFDDYDLDVMESYQEILIRYCGWNKALRSVG